MRLSKIFTSLFFILISVGIVAQEKPSDGASAFKVSGVVKEAATGKALGGIRVTYKDYAAAITDSNGAFTIKVPSPDLNLLFEGEGYQAKQIAIKGNGNVIASLYEDTYTSFY